MTRASRPTIGFLTANVHIGAARALWPGVLDASASADVDLVCFPGGRLHALDELESQRNVLYDLINPQRLDGLLSWPSTLAGRVAPDEVVAFHSKFQPLPIVSLASPVGQAAMVTIDSGPGMRALVSHLVDVHGYTRIALVRARKGIPMPASAIRYSWAPCRRKGSEKTRRWSRRQWPGNVARRPCRSCWTSATCGRVRISRRSWPPATCSPSAP